VSTKSYCEAQKKKEKEKKGTGFPFPGDFFNSVRMASNLAIRAPEKKISSDVSIANLKAQEAEAWALHVAEAKKVRPKNTKNSLPPMRPTSLTHQLSQSIITVQPRSWKRFLSNLHWGL